MAKSLIFKKGLGEGISFNMTPLIDVTFQLIIFFIIAGQVSSKELAQAVKLHRPVQSQVIQDPQGQALNRVVVNVISRASTVGRGERLDPALAGLAAHYEIMGKKIDVGNVPDLKTAMTRYMDIAASRRQEKKEFMLMIRADYRVNYSQVEPVMAAAMEAEVPKMTLRALRGG